MRVKLCFLFCHPDRNLKEEVQTFRGHKKEASAVAWHPIHEGAFASGGSDGAIMFWNVRAEKEIGVIEQVSCYSLLFTFLILFFMPSKTYSMSLIRICFMKMQIQPKISI
jgi:WD40 repeat protein